MFDIISFGSNTVDIFVHTEHAELKKGKVKVMAYPVGAKILITGTRFTTGGGGTNTAVAFSRLGLNTAYLGAVSNDNFGQEVMKMLKQEKIAFVGFRGEETNGFSVILDSISHNRTILAFKGQNDKIRFEDLPLKKLRTRWFYFSSMMGTSFKTQARLARWAHENYIKIAFNPSSYLAKKGARYLKPILKYTDILILNKEEAMMLVKKDLFKKLHMLGPKIVCITDGEKGVHASDGEYLYSIKPRKVKVEEATGAGDSFASGFVAAYVNHKDIETCLKTGLANAESVISHAGAKNILLTWSEAVRDYKRYPFKLKKVKL